MEQLTYWLRATCLNVCLRPLIWF